MKNLKLLIVDDHELVRESFNTTLNSNCPEGYFFLIDEASDGSEAVNKATKIKYDIIFMDVRLPNVDGIAATKDILKVHPETRIIGISMFKEDHEIKGMLAAGAMGYILKNTSKKELFEAIDAVLNDSHYFSKEIPSNLRH
ncbi:response regulator transcription factor [Crocinitomix catalasitica]|nr:response regulator transcription factor [Crocinitomix catalasitica]